MVSIKKDHIYEVGIIGAGPAGATCAFYLGKEGKDVLLLDKKKFPRRKICGDAITVRAQQHLERMGVLEEIIAEKKGNWAALGGLVSPSGIAYYGDSSDQVSGHLVIAIKREIMDEKVVRAAEKADVKFIENFSVANVEFSNKEKYWIINSEKEKNACKVRVLIIADGAASRLGRELGYVEGLPQATCSSIYIESGSHNFKQDGVCYYTKELVPGYCALFKEADGDLVYCCYIIPGGKCTTSDLTKMHYDLLENDPFISEAVGKNAKIEKMKAAPIRFGGISKSYGDNLLIIGDAAGQIDPLTGEGIQYAMDAGEIAAKTVIEAFQKNRFDKRFLRKYQRRWMRSFGRDFKWSARMVKALVRYPIFLDAFASLCNRKGDKFMTEWGKIMTGSKAKLNFFLPNLAFPLLTEILRLKRKQRKKKE
ncbi:MAG: NAD(P)/FAD-dependent oxidoreductase [Candidatus Heimdallarchaeota archaeon]|nr:NAD(P)/FAD-dependent oxidoreductase [Candidatus Heimdallarchaeota archaeon]